jgi:uncharacterized protein
VRFWDSSAIVPLLVAEPTTRRMQRVHAEDPALIVWWATGVECASAIARIEREGRLDDPDVAVAFARLDALAQGWLEVQPVDAVRRTATRLLRTNQLRAADALQVAAAVTYASGDPHAVELVTLDDRLAGVAAREGFRVLALSS